MYILSIKKVYTFHRKTLYFLPKRYIPFWQKVYTFFKETIILS